MHLSNRIKKLREAAGIEREDLADGIVSYSHLSNIESGRFIPSHEILIALAEKLNVPKEYFLKHKEKDQQLEGLLNLLKKNIDLSNLKDAETVINRIQLEYPLIQSIEQETFFYLLKTYYWFKIGQKETAYQSFEHQVLPLLNNIEAEAIPDLMKEVYYYLWAMYHFHKESYHESHQYLIKLFPLVNEPIVKAAVHYNLALALIRMNNSKVAISYALDALNIYLHERKWAEAADTDNLLGIIYWENGDLIDAEKHLNRALDMVIQYRLSNLESTVYHNFGLLYKSKKEIEKSKEYFLRSIELKKNQNQYQRLVITYIPLLNIYMEQGLLDQVKSILLEVKQHTSKKFELCVLKEIEAKLNLKTGNFNEYVLLMKETIDYFYENKLWKFVEYNAIQLAEFYQTKRVYKQSSKFYQMALKANKKLCGRDLD